MSDMDQILGSLLSDPNMMEKISALAQQLNLGNPPQAPTPPPQEAAALDPEMLRAIMGLAQRSNIDSNQTALLNALHPYLSPGRIKKLERAMRAVKMAGMASGFFNAGGLQLLSGR